MNKQNKNMEVKDIPILVIYTKKISNNSSAVKYRYIGKKDNSALEELVKVSILINESDNFDLKKLDMTFNLNLFDEHYRMSVNKEKVRNEEYQDKVFYTENGKNYSKITDKKLWKSLYNKVKDFID